jgi:DNA adenine methylase
MWAGGKSKLLSHYKPLFPEDIHGRRLYEPFAGGAALFNHLSNQHPIKASLSDVNAEIIGLYRLVRNDPDFLIRQMTQYQDQWLPLEKSGRKSLYYNLRETYWDLEEGKQATALLYFLMKTGFNGIWQTCKASRGRYGTPVGLANQKSAVFDPKIITAWSKKLEHVDLSCSSYSAVNVSSGSFVFCDPPYRDSFTSYGTDFDDREQIKLIDWCREIHQTTNSLVWLSNRDAGDGFFETHAPDATLHRFPVTYTAGRRKKTEDGFEAKPATEVLLVWDIDSRT